MACKRGGRSSRTIEVELWVEALLTGERRRAAEAEFVMAAVDPAVGAAPIAA